jgi:S1-C subfamily serine protease
MAAFAARRLLSPLLAASALLTLQVASQAEPKKDKVRERLLQASVFVVPKACAGSVVGSPSHVLTAAHCIPAGDQRVPVRLRSGQRVDSRVEFLDEERDLALLHLDQPAPVEPLALSPDLPAAGDKLSFVGRFDRAPRKPQRAEVLKLGQCPSLPAVDDAVFTSLNARPGYSGAPVVDTDLRVVAIVHGGAACHIAAPVSTLAQRLAADPDGELEQPSDPGATTPDEGHVLGPFLFEKTPGGFRFRWSFRFGGAD